MTSASQQKQHERIAKIVLSFTIEYLNRLLWNLNQIVPIPGERPERDVLNKLYGGHIDDLQHTGEPQKWLAMALYGAGLVEADPEEIHGICQSMAKQLFALPDNLAYDIPNQWARSDMGVLWWQALLRSKGDELITIAKAAELAGVSIQAISGRIDRGTLQSFTDPLASDRQGKRLVRRSDITPKES